MLESLRRYFDLSFLLCPFVALKPFFSNQNTRTFFDKRLRISTKDIPKGKPPALKRPLGINGTAVFPAVKEQAFKFVASKSFPDGITAVNWDKIFPNKINNIYLQETGDIKDFIVSYPDLPGFAPTTLPGTTGTRPGIKAKVKTILV